MYSLYCRCLDMLFCPVESVSKLTIFRHLRIVSVVMSLLS